MIIKTNGKRVQRFHTGSNDFKSQFNTAKIHKKDDGLSVICGTSADSTKPSSELSNTNLGVTAVSEWGFAPDSEDIWDKEYLQEARNKLYKAQECKVPKIDVEAVATERFGYKR